MLYIINKYSNEQKGFELSNKLIKLLIILLSYIYSFEYISSFSLNTYFNS